MRRGNGLDGRFGSYSAGYIALAVPTALCCWSLLAAGRAAARAKAP